VPGVPPGRYAYLGPPGTFCEAAARSLPAAGRTELLPQRSVTLALEAVRSGEAQGAMVPMESSVEGSVAATLDGLATGEPLQITREVVLAVSFALLVRPGTGLEDVRTVSTVPHAEAQVRGFLDRELPDARLLPAPSTADGAQAVAAGQADAAVAGRLAADRYRLAVLTDGIEDVPGAVTRFVLVVPPGLPPPPTGADRTSLVAVQRADRPGALLQILTEFAVRGVNLTRLESRPTGAGLGRYRFSIDCDGHLAEARIAETLSALHRVCAEVRFLGSYPRADGEPVEVPPDSSDADFADAAAWLAALRAGRPAP
jgi:prephenate dehydratase